LDCKFKERGTHGLSHRSRDGGEFHSRATQNTGANLLICKFVRLRTAVYKEDLVATKWVKERSRKRPLKRRNLLRDKEGHRRDMKGDIGREQSFVSIAEIMSALNETTA
jgi:hypothetical protein